MIREIFEWWTRLVGGLARGSNETWRSALRTFERLRAGEQDALGDPAFVVVGVVSLLVGAAFRIGLSAPGDAKTAAVVAAAAAVAWAAIRLGTLIAMQPTQRIARRKLVGAWAAGTLVWVIAASPGLALLAWALSAVVTFVVLVRMEVGRSHALTAIAVAWGLQATVTIASLVSAGGWAVFMSTRL